MYNRHFFKPFLLTLSFALTFIKGNCQAQNLINDKIFLDALVSENWNTASSVLSGNLKGQIPQGGIEKIFTNAEQQLGKFQRYDTTAVLASNRSASFVCSFAKETLLMQIASNDSAMIVGFFFRPLEKAYQPPAYADRSAFKQKDMFIQTDSMRLPAILTMPAKTGKWPVLLFVGGSGPNDKDETLGAEKPFRDLAMGLGVNGIASLRFDKRSLVYPGNFKSRNYTLTDEYLEDIKNAITNICHLEGVDTSRIYLLGHSMGGMIAPLILKENKILKGAVMLEANARPLQELILEQMEYLSFKDTSKQTSSGNIEQVKKEVAGINNITEKDSGKDYLGAKGSYWLSLNKYDQLIVASKLKSPKLLIIQGGEDYQVNNTDFQLWKIKLNGKTTVQFNFLEKINHALVEGNGSMSPSDYSIPKNVPKYLVDLITEWINKK